MGAKNSMCGGDTSSVSSPSKAPPAQRLFVITSLFMPLYSKARIELYRRFEERMKEYPEVELWTIECSLISSPEYHVTRTGNPRHVQVRCDHPLWFKENLLNILVSKLPSHCKYIAWIDADVIFMDDMWAKNTLSKLKKVDVVQLFEDSDFLGGDGKVQCSAKSLMYYAKKNLSMIKEYNKKEETYPHPGYAWAMTMQFYRQIGNFFELNIVGSGDKLMAYSLFGDWEYGLQQGYKLHPEFISCCQDWATKSIPELGYDYVPGRLIHEYHGERGDRGYVNRWGLLSEYRFNPKTDLYKNMDGVIQLKDHQTELRMKLMMYFENRKEHLITLGKPPSKDMLKKKQPEKKPQQDKKPQSKKEEPKKEEPKKPQPKKEEPYKPTEKEPQFDLHNYDPFPDPPKPQPNPNDQSGHSSDDDHHHHRHYHHHHHHHHHNDHHNHNDHKHGWY